jgi:hypothetical protein
MNMYPSGAFGKLQKVVEQVGIWFAESEYLSGMWIGSLPISHTIFGGQGLQYASVSLSVCRKI